MLILVSGAGRAFADQNLLAWWKLDGQTGGVVSDESGNGRDGTIHSNPQWVAGVDGGSLRFDGSNDYVVHSFSQRVFPEFTLAMWVRTDVFGQDEYSSVFSGYTPNSAGFQIDVDGSDPGSYRVNPGGFIFGPVSPDWVHLAMVCEGTSVSLYYNGVQTNTGVLGDAIFNQFALGINRNGSIFFAGTMDDFRAYDRALAPAEIAQLAQPDASMAWNPYPADQAEVDVLTIASVSWSAGETAIAHDVFFGDDPDAVLNADTSTSGIYRGQHDLSETTYAPPEGFEFGRMYYWRIDELNDDRTITKGRLWRFEVGQYAVVDDFEGYADTNELRLVWHDGNSANQDVQLESESSGNFLRLTLDHNQPPYCSEIQMVYDSPRDWTAGGAKAMEMQYRGRADNPPAQLYVALTDEAGNDAAVLHAETDALMQYAWQGRQQWVIALQSFTHSGGVDLTRIKEVSIGTAYEPDGDTNTASGQVDIDDIRLYASRCLPGHVASSLDDDCVTDANDLAILMRYWLVSDYSIAALQPDSSRLQVHYKFDETSGAVTGDSSGRERHGTVDAEGADAWDADGYDGACLNLDGTFGVSVPGEVFGNVSDEVTISVWVGADSADWAEFGSGPAESGQARDRLIWTKDKPTPNAAKWNHYAFVKDSRRGLMRTYRNGLLVAEKKDALLPMDNAGTGPARIGAGLAGQGGYYQGKLDDFRVYDYALSHPEILYLAAGPDAAAHQPLKPVLAPVDPCENGRIDFADFALLAQRWLSEILWP